MIKDKSILIRVMLSYIMISGGCSILPISDPPPPVIDQDFTNKQIDDLVNLMNKKITPLVQVKLHKRNLFAEDNSNNSQGFKQTTNPLFLGSLNFMRQPSLLAYSPAISPTGMPRKTFVIMPALKGKLVNTTFFEINQYTIETGGDPTKLGKATGICNEINKLRLEKFGYQPLIKSLKSKFSASASSTIPGITANGSGEIEAEVNPQVLNDFLAALILLYSIKTSRIEIYVRGYADGVHGKNKERRLGKLDPDYNYFKIDLHPSIKSSRNPLIFNRKAVAIPVPISNKVTKGYYNNQDLPNLRARFLKEDIIEPIIQGCVNPTKTDISILEGYEFSKSKKPSDRKVQAFVLIY